MPARGDAAANAGASRSRRFTPQRCERRIGRGEIRTLVENTRRQEVGEVELVDHAVVVEIAAAPARVRRAGAHAVLCGEALMRAPDPAALMASFRSA